MKRTTTSKLALHRETLRRLAEGTLDRVRGGFPFPIVETYHPLCKSKTCPTETCSAPPICAAGPGAPDES